MIKITVQNDQESNSFIFYTKEVSIGSADSNDLALPSASLKPKHIIIEEERDRFIIKNLAHDPFATLNDHPFGKRILQNQDVIRIGCVQILFEGELASKGLKYEQFPIIKTKTDLIAVVEQVLQASDIPIEGNADHKEDTQVEFMEMNQGEMEALLEEWQEIEHEFREERTSVIKEVCTAPPPVPKQAVILELTDNDQEPFPFKQKEKPEMFASEESEKPYNHFFNQIQPMIRVLGISIIIGVITLILLSLAFFSIFSQENEKKVIQVSRGVADIAIALSYAKIHHIIPGQHNWSNPQFLKSSVASSLSPYHFSHLKLESNGKIHEDYLLRIYTNLDNSRFIIIAQPEPSLFHYFTIPDSVIVDSSIMSIHRINDLKALNRLLIDPEQLDNPGNDEVFQIINAAAIVPLDALADENNTNGFKTPEFLNKFHPGAENLIYNSPRYSQVGEKIMNDALEIAAHSINSTEIRKMKELVLSVSKYPTTVIYTTKGKQHALRAKEALESLDLEADLLIAYIDYDPKTNAISSNLINQANDSTLRNDKNNESFSNPAHLSKASAASYLSEAKGLKQTSHFSRDIQDNPLYAKLNELSNKRKIELLSIKDELQTMIEKEIEEPGSYPLKKIRNAAEKLTLKIEELNITILKDLHHLYGQHKNIPLCEFLEFVERSGLRHLPNNELFPNQTKSETLSCNFTEEGLEALNGIEKAADFEFLFQAIEKSSSYLSSDQSEDPQLIMSYQNQVKGRVIDKLNEFILLKKSDNDANEFNDSNQEKLISALKKAWIFDKEEQDYYLSEFFLRKKSSPLSENFN